MAKKADIQAQIDALTAQLEDADTDDEVWIKDGNREVKVTGKKATTILGRFADLWTDSSDDDDDQDDDDQDDAKGGKGGKRKDDKPSGGGYFGRR